MQLNTRMLLVLATAATLGSGCARYTDTSGGEVIDAAEAAKTVLLHVNNLSPQSMELRAIVNGNSTFIGSVGSNDSTSLLLDPVIFPTATLYLVGIPAGGRGRAVVGPLAASKGDMITFTIESAFDLSRAIVRRQANRVSRERGPDSTWEWSDARTPSRMPIWLPAS